MSNIVPILKAEIAQLEDDLRNDPRHRKIERLRATLAEYEPDIGQPGVPRVPGANGLVGWEKIVPSPRTKEDKIRAELVALFNERGSVHRNEILKHLQQKELMGHEKDPLANLAAYLSNWKDIFAFDGKGNWSLKPT